MDIHEITSLITKVAETVEANEKLALPILAAKARREASARPTDIPLVNASNVLTKMASDRTFISRDELRNVLERFTASHSKLSEAFSEEIGKKAEVKTKTFERYADEGQSLDRDYAKFADPILANALAGAMSENPTEQLYSQADAQRAQRAAYAKLLEVGIQPKDIKTFAGRKDIIVVQAVHETPLGVSNVLIPVELKEGKAILPSLFLSRFGFQDIEKSAYGTHLKATAGKAFRVDGSKLLDVLEQVKNGSSDVANEVEMAAIKIASEKGTRLHDPNAILYTQIDKETPDVQLPKMASNEESRFAETLGKPDGVARFIHGDRVVEAGRSMLIRKLAEIGYKSVQVRVADVEQDKIFYAIALGTGTGLKVPVEVNGNMVIPPKVVYADNFITAFSKKAIDEVVATGSGGNRRALATASPCYDMKPTELLEVVKESIAEGNYLRAEDAINVLGEVDRHAQRVAIAHMMMNISESGKNPDSEISEMQRIAATPVRDVPQFMTHKIFFPEGA